MTFDENDVQNAALCATKEGRGDGSYLGVLWVIANRAEDWNLSLHEVIYAKNQFTSMSVSSDPEFNWTPSAPADIDVYNECLGAAPAAFARSGDDPTGGSHYYANLEEVTSGWFTRNIVESPEHPLMATIGKQSFFL